MTDKKYIEREAAKNILLQHQHRFTCADEANGYGSVKWSEDVIYISEAVNGMDDIPAADVRPVVRGKWRLGGYGQISDATVKWYDKFLQGGFFYCSNCKERSRVKTNFCPNCGADMREES